MTVNHWNLEMENEKSEMEKQQYRIQLTRNGIKYEKWWIDKKTQPIICYCTLLAAKRQHISLTHTVLYTHIHCCDNRRACEIHLFWLWQNKERSIQRTMTHSHRRSSSSIYTDNRIEMHLGASIRIFCVHFSIGLFTIVPGGIKSINQEIGCFCYRSNYSRKKQFYWDRLHFDFRLNRFRVSLSSFAFQKADRNIRK